MDKKIIDSYYIDALANCEAMWVILETLGYKCFGKVFDSYSIYLGENNKPKYSKRPFTVADPDSYATSRICNMKLIDELKSNEEIWIHCINFEISNNTIIIGKDFYMGIAPNNENWVLQIYAENEEVVKRLCNYVSPVEIQIHKYYNYITADSSGFNASSFKIKSSLDVPLENYLDDFPFDQVKAYCESEDPGIFLFYGEPGCGKSYMLRKLIKECNTKFYILDASILNNITSTVFIDFLLDECSNSVLVLEDCEKLLSDRNLGYNPFIGTVLNLTDGILGDGLQLRFICTFNTEISNIDPAILRKGRLKGKYEFKKLPKDKANKLCEKLEVEKINRDATLAEIYNRSENDYSKKENRKVGF